MTEAVTYDQAIKCPRCGRRGNVRVAENQDVGRLGSCFCTDKKCSFYGRFWFFTLNDANEVLSHTHTIYKDPEPT